MIWIDYREYTLVYRYAGRRPRWRGNAAKPYCLPRDMGREWFAFTLGGAISIPIGQYWYNLCCNCD
jgi:hypothetical protein